MSIHRYVSLKLQRTTQWFTTTQKSQVLLKKNLEVVRVVVEAVVVVEG